jgi:hypothetical protein
MFIYSMYVIHALARITDRLMKAGSEFKNVGMKDTAKVWMS